MNRYSVAELRSKTREILNAAQSDTVIITRYDEEFVLTKVGASKVVVDEVADLSDKQVEKLHKVIKKPSDIPPGVQVPGSCVHGAAPGFCKVQKCPNSKRA